jgi:hypothetical protein
MCMHMTKMCMHMAKMSMHIGFYVQAHVNRCACTYFTGNSCSKCECAPPMSMHIGPCARTSQDRFHRHCHIKTQANNHITHVQAHVLCACAPVAMCMHIGCHVHAHVLCACTSAVRTHIANNSSELPRHSLAVHPRKNALGLRPGTGGTGSPP